MFKSLVLSSLFLFSSVAMAEIGKPVFLSTSNAQDLVDICRFTNVKVPDVDYSKSSPEEVDRAWYVVSSKAQCLSFVVGIALSDQMHTLKMNRILNREPEDTTYAGICVPENVPITQLATTVVNFTNQLTSADRKSHKAGVVAYSALAAAYPCSLSNPL